MRRISLALALLGAVAAAGCKGGSNSSASGSGKGVPGSTFTVTLNSAANPVVGGRIQSAGGVIDCGVGAPVQKCSGDFAWGSSVTLTASAVAPNAYWMFAGDCTGEGTCVLDGNADKYVLVRFSALRFQYGHPNFSDGNVHGPVVMGGMDCQRCHGPQLAGQGLAPACTKCHDWTPAWIQTMLDTYMSGTASTAAVAKKTGLNIAISSVSTTTPITVQFTMKDDAGRNVDPTGLNSGAGWSANRNQPMAITVGLVYFGADTAGNYLNFVSSTAGNPATVSAVSNTTSGTKTSGATQQGNLCTTAAPCVCSSKNPCATYPLTAAAGTLTFNQATGVYTYTFQNPTTGALTAAFPNPATNPGATNTTVWIATLREENLTNFYDASKYTAVNADYSLVTPGYTGTSVARAIVDEASCAKCHDGFANESTFDANGVATSFSAFHSGARLNPRYCNVCHYKDRGLPGRAFTDGGADSKSFVHRIHSAEQFEAPTNAYFDGIAVGYPQDVRNCGECHPNTAQGRQYKTRPTRTACVGCHYNVVFTADPLAATSVAHSGGAQADDTGCVGCHSAAQIDGYHVPVLPKDPTNSLDLATGGNSRTNAGNIAAVGALPPGATRLTALVSGVARNASKQPTITFKLQSQGPSDPAPVDVVFNTSTVGGTTNEELINNFVGTIGVYFAMAVPQDGITAPADFNATMSSDVKRLWNGKATSTSKGTLTGPVGGYYTATLTGVTVPDSAGMLTGGIGYQYSLPATQPFTQTNLAAYPTAASPTTPGALTGGLIVPIPNVWATATGYTARRTVVSNDRCNNCHGALGVAPNFHVGQRNNAPTCAFCHNVNTSSSGWSANASTFLHGIHGAAKRTTPFGWHSGGCPTGSTWTGTVCSTGTGTVAVQAPFFADVEFPGSACTDCHVPGSYDFSNATNAAAVPSLLWTYSVTGTPGTAQTTVPAGVTPTTNYGAAFKYAADTGVTTAAASTTLVTSPIAAACYSCHDDQASIDHMTVIGGARIYSARGATSGLASQEGCLGCHGPGSLLSIQSVHAR